MFNPADTRFAARELRKAAAAAAFPARGPGTARLVEAGGLYCGQMSQRVARGCLELPDVCLARTELAKKRCSKAWRAARRCARVRGAAEDRKSGGEGKRV